MRGVAMLGLFGLACASQSTVVLPIGDSITVGESTLGFVPGAWRSRLEAIDPSISFCGPVKINPAPGQVSTSFAAWSGVYANWFANNSAAWRSYVPQADLVVLMTGTNDIAQGRSASRLAADIDGACRSILSYQRRVTLVVCTVPPERSGAKQAVIDETNAAIYAQTNQLRREGFDVSVAPTDQAYYPVQLNMVDLIHPSQRGYDAMAPILYQALQPLVGDVDGDGSVGLFDYLEFCFAFDTAIGMPDYHGGADVDRDGNVSMFDYMLLSEHFGETKFLR